MIDARNYKTRYELEKAMEIESAKSKIEYLNKEIGILKFKKKYIIGEYDIAINKLISEKLRLESIIES